MRNSAGNSKFVEQSRNLYNVKGYYEVFIVSNELVLQLQRFLSEGYSSVYLLHTVNNLAHAGRDTL